ncbi:MAG: class II fructose-bisphosphate aldolase [Armatimonadetes bacterium]|nr:class II fructose-bisphosphate aldolase [Armatimonadota bacterium]
MPLILHRDDVLSAYEAAVTRGWVIPAFGVENLTTIEAVLAATRDCGQRVGRADLPVILALTNLYEHRTQSRYYTHTRRWDVGMKLFLADVAVLTAADSPFADLSVMIHLDHIQPDLDADLLTWDMGQFSSIMFDASKLPLEENMEATARFVREHGDRIVIEGACDEIVDATGDEISVLTTPERAEEFVGRTGVDLIVANLGTEHRASAADLWYHGDLARQIKEVVGRKLVLHGTSSVPNDQIGRLFDDGICKVNIWTALERDSSPALLEQMVRHASKVGGPQMAQRLNDDRLLGNGALLADPFHLDFFTTAYRQGIVFEEMKRVVTRYLGLWYG